MTAPVRTGLSPQGGGPVRSAHHMRGYPRSLAQAPRTSVTQRQLQMLRLAANGKTNQSIARALGITEDGVKSQMRSTLRKLRVSDRAQAVAVALRLGLLKLDDIEVPADANVNYRDGV
jgi:DNA-binding CsgD family transcriptional regulator